LEAGGDLPAIGVQHGGGLGQCRRPEDGEGEGVELARRKALEAGEDRRVGGGVRAGIG